MDSVFHALPCKRCDLPCQLADGAAPPQPGWPITARYARSADGLCRECMAHWLIFTVDGLRWMWDEHRDTPPEVLADTTVQQILGRALVLGSPDLGVIDWGRLLDQWALPWPEEWMPLWAVLDEQLG